ncbi:MAG TPA: FAD:protein FMN transferase, partial [Rhodobacteraceae bacterium]|nr:FAD:protein FMN transferase [Paracoccaceae bacterium]
MTGRLAPLLLAGLLLLTGCRGPEKQVSATFYVFGTLVEIIIRTDDEPGAQVALAAAGRELRRIHEDAHAWKPGELTRLNKALAAGRPFAASPFLVTLLRQAKDFSRASGGLFNPAIGGLIALWGFHGDTLPVGPPPADERIEALLRQKPMMDDIRLNGRMVSSRNRAVQLDFGGFAKGAALDRIGRLLKKRGFGNAILNAGGDV